MEKMDEAAETAPATNIKSLSASLRPRIFMSRRRTVHDDCRTKTACSEWRPPTMTTTTTMWEKNDPRQSRPSCEAQGSYSTDCDKMPPTRTDLEFVGSIAIRHIWMGLDAIPIQIRLMIAGCWRRARSVNSLSGEQYGQSTGKLK